jgi:hypothetical protein
VGKIRALSVREFRLPKAVFGIMSLRAYFDALRLDQLDRFAFWSHTLSARKDRDGWVPAAMTLEDIAYHFRVGITKWKELVERGVMPHPRVIDSLVLYDTSECEAAFREIPHRGDIAAKKPSLAEQMRL